MRGCGSRSVGVGASARFWNAASTYCAITLLNFVQVLHRNRFDFTARLYNSNRMQCKRMCG